MPYIVKRRIGRPNKATQSDIKRHNDRWGKYYNNSAWKRLRNWYIQSHPLCERCLFNGKSVPSEEVHHKVEFSKGETMEDKFALLLDPQNLMAVCRKCHMEIHNHNKKLNSEHE